MRRPLWLSCWWGLILCGWMVSAWAQNPANTVVIDPQVGKTPLSPALVFVADDDDNIRPEQILAFDRRLDWQFTRQQVPNLGFDHRPYWFRFKLVNPTDQPLVRYVSLEQPLLDDVRYYLSTTPHQPTVVMGDGRPFDQRLMESRDFVLPLVVAAHDSVVVALRVQTEGSLQMPMTLWQPRSFERYQQLDTLTHVILIGMILSLGFFSLIVSFNSRQFSYLWWGLHLIGYSWVVATLTGLPAQWLWPDSPYFNNLAMPIFLALTNIASILFTFSFLRLQRMPKPLQQLYYGLAAAFVLLALGSFVFPAHFSLQMIMALAMVETICSVAVAVLLWRHHEESMARIYSIARMTFMAGTLVYLCSKVGMIDSSARIELFLPISLVLESLLLSMALTNQIRLHKEASLMSQQNMLRIQQQANQQLEMTVLERTRALQEANQQLQHMARRDGLTGVFNRSYFDQTFAQEWKRATRTHHPLAIMLMDADFFKQINDQHGHQIGDECLKHLCNTVGPIINRAGDFVARYGGEEFVIFLTHTDLSGAMIVAERIRRQIAKQPLEWQDKTIPLSVSIGVASVRPYPHSSAQALIENADQACYHAKRTGRNRVVGYKAEGGKPQFLSYLQFFDPSSSESRPELSAVDLPAVSVSQSSTAPDA